jgi:hypothetical protein
MVRESADTIEDLLDETQFRRRFGEVMYRTARARRRNRAEATAEMSPSFWCIVWGRDRLPAKVVIIAPARDQFRSNPITTQLSAFGHSRVEQDSAGNLVRKINASACAYRSGLSTTAKAGNHAQTV